MQVFVIHSLKQQPLPTPSVHLRVYAWVCVRITSASEWICLCLCVKWKNEHKYTHFTVSHTQFYYRSQGPNQMTFVFIVYILRENLHRQTLTSHHSQSSFIHTISSKQSNQPRLNFVRTVCTLFVLSFYFILFSFFIKFSFGHWNAVFSVKKKKGKNDK